MPKKALGGEIPSWAWKLAAAVFAVCVLLWLSFVMSWFSKGSSGTNPAVAPAPAQAPAPKLSRPAAVVATASTPTTTSSTAGVVTASVDPTQTISPDRLVTDESPHVDEVVLCGQRTVYFPAPHESPNYPRGLFGVTIGGEPKGCWSVWYKVPKGFRAFAVETDGTSQNLSFRSNGDTLWSTVVMSRAEFQKAIQTVSLHIPPTESATVLFEKIDDGKGH